MGIRVCLKGSLIPFSKTMLVGSPLGPMTSSSAIGSWLDLQYRAWAPSCGVGLKCNQKVLLVTSITLYHYNHLAFLDPFLGYCG